jgi:hypothetical protein
MTKKFKVLDYDIIYLSYDEPNAEQNYNNLLKKVPWAKRVHGIKGSDAAHKACAALSETDRFITVDGDNIVDAEFLSKEFNFDENRDLEKCVISWTARNTINGLMYGNGGLKCWPREYVLNMKTHENADPGNPHAQVDFCWDIEYIQMNSCYSEIMNNATPHQAWRAGFREGVKMALDRGIRPSIEDFYKNHWKNMHRLYIWLCVGADVKNGLWGIYGARQGLYKTMLTDWDYVNVRDFDYLNNMWNTEVQHISEPDDMEALYEANIILGRKIHSGLELPFPIIPLDDQQSKFFKTVYQNPVRTERQQFIDRED